MGFAARDSFALISRNYPFNILNSENTKAGSDTEAKCRCCAAVRNPGSGVARKKLNALRKNTHEFFDQCFHGCRPVFGKFLHNAVGHDGVHGQALMTQQTPETIDR